MATVKLTDIIDVEIYEGIASENNPELTAFFESGVVVRSPEMDRLATAEAELVNMPFWRDLDPADEPNYSSDADTSAVPNKIVQGKMAAKRVSLNNAWSARDLTNEMTMGDIAMERIKARTSTYWVRQWQRRLIATSVGIYNANIIASDAGMDSGFGETDDMVFDISIDNGVGAEANFFDREAFTNARFTLGDHFGDLSAILCHSVIYQRMIDQDDIDFIPDSQQSGVIPLYQGHRVIVDDSAPTVATTSGGGIRYTTILYGAAAFAYGEGSPTTPVEVDRNPYIGDGGGEETLFERKTWLLHPFGHSNLDVTNNGGGGLWQNIADLKLGTNWKRNHFRKNVPIAFLVTNG